VGSSHLVQVKVYNLNYTMINNDKLLLA